MKDEIVTINGKRYRKLRTLWNGNLMKEKVTVDNKGFATFTLVNETIGDICANDKWCMINGIEYEELDELSK